MDINMTKNINFFKRIKPISILAIFDCISDIKPSTRIHGIWIDYVNGTEECEEVIFKDWDDDLTEEEYDLIQVAANKYYLVFFFLNNRMEIWFGILT